jgi:isopentenyl diphosphate isomerase/L-lactate dehydrogenase-like FMN-dependent dehydrogenase
MPASPEPFNCADFERLARETLPEGTYGYFAGGAGDEVTLRDNVAAYARWQLRPRMLVDVSAPRTVTTVMGREVSMPLLVAPTAFHRLAHPDGEAATARAAAAVGTVMCLSTLATSTPAEVADAAPDGPRWFQLYHFRDEAVTRSLIDQAAESGYEALVLTVDAPFAGRRERDFRTGFALPPDVSVPSIAAVLGRDAQLTVQEVFALVDPSLTWRDLERISSLSDLPLLVKGILTEEDGRLAVEHGAAGVVVSNHGGRQLDGVPAALDVLPEVVEAADGRIEVFVDGGIRRGTDVVKALALGARAAGGEQGAQRVLELLRDEIELALCLCGCASPEAVTRDHLRPAPR